MGHQLALETSKRWGTILPVGEGCQARQPEVLANALLLLMDGAYMAARMYGASASNPAAKRISNLP